MSQDSVVGDNSDMFFDDGEFENLLDEKSLSTIDSLTSFESSGDSSTCMGIMDKNCLRYLNLCVFSMYVDVLDNSSTSDLSNPETSKNGVDSCSGESLSELSTDEPNNLIASINSSSHLVDPVSIKYCGCLPMHMSYKRSWYWF